MSVSLTTAARAFLDEVHFGTLATVNPQDIPSQVLVWYMLDGKTSLSPRQQPLIRSATSARTRGHR